MKVRHRQAYYALTLLGCDFVSIVAGLYAAFWFRFQSGLLPLPLGIPNFELYTQAFFVIVLFLIFTFRAHGLYVEERISTPAEEIWLVIRAVTVTTLVLLAISFFFRDAEFSRLYLPVAWASVIVCVVLARLAAAAFYVTYRQRHNKLKEVLAVGANRITARYAIHHLRESRLCTKVVGVLDSRHPRLTLYKRLPVQGRPADLERVLAENENINEVIVTTGEIPHDDVFRMMMLCEKNLVSFKWCPDILGLLAAQMRVRYELGLPFLSSKESPLADWENRLIKRAIDVAASAAALVLLSPLLAIVALWIRRDSEGPVLYKQDRVGEDGQIFKMCKFRTMKHGAERETGPVWAKEQDARRTRIGGFLRASNIDELPQLWNVLKGDMSLVGPRPERPHFVGQFREDVPRYMGRHRIKSGITGWAQVNGLRGNTSIEERTKYDLFYIENWSVLFDVKILFMTLTAFKNAY